jgi:molecular chaperone GrpE
MAERNEITKESRVEIATDGESIPIRIVKKEEPIRVTDKRFWMQPESEQEKADEYSFKPAYVEELEKRLSDSQKRLDEVLASYRQFKAESTLEVQRAKDRLQNEYNRRLAQARCDVVTRFIDVLENLDRALAASKMTQTLGSLLEGVGMIRNQFASALSELGLQELDLIDRPFNPEVAEAVGVVEVNAEQDQKVVEVVGKGYVLQETLVRPAKVRVGKCPISVPETSSIPS